MKFTKIPGKSVDIVFCLMDDQKAYIDGFSSCPGNDFVLPRNLQVFNLGDYELVIYPESKVWLYDSMKYVSFKELHISMPE